MIAHLKGTALKKSDKTVIVSTGNVGYLVHLTASLLSSVEEGSSVEFFIHTQVREDAFDLYGFIKYEELTLFQRFIAVNGVGPRVALEILNVPSDKIVSAIANEDADFICKIPGIGQKTAKRLILELKGKLETNNISVDYKTPDTNPDAIEALLKLGYQRGHISGILKNMPKDITDAEHIITYFLKNA